MAEQLALDQPGRDRSTVDLHERALAALAAAVDRAREQLLSGPRLAENEHGRVRRCNQLDPAESLKERCARPYDLVEVVLGADLLLEVYVLGLEPSFQRLELLEGLAQLVLRCRATRHLAPHALVQARIGQRDRRLRRKHSDDLGSLGRERLAEAVLEVEDSTGAPLMAHWNGENGPRPAPRQRRVGGESLVNGRVIDHHVLAGAPNVADHALHEGVMVLARPTDVDLLSPDGGFDRQGCLSLGVVDEDPPLRPGVL